MRSRRCIWIFLFAAVVAQVFVPARNLAQEFKASGKRKIVAQVRPVYPELARKMNISGTVRLGITVGAGGDGAAGDHGGGRRERGGQRSAWRQSCVSAVRVGCGSQSEVGGCEPADEGS